MESFSEEGTSTLSLLSVPISTGKGMTEGISAGWTGLGIGIIVPMQVKNRIREEGDLVAVFSGWDPMEPRRGEHRLSLAIVLV